MYTIIVISVAVICLIIGFVIGKISTSTDAETEFLRRGIVDKTFTYSKSNEDVNVQVEIGEIEKTKQKSKIKVINMIFRSSSHSTYANKLKIEELLNNSWIDSSTIEWIEDDTAQQRNKKIEQILK